MWRVTVVDDFTHECPAIEVNHSLAGANVAQTLNRLGRASKHVDLKPVRQRDGGECACSRLNQCVPPSLPVTSTSSRVIPCSRSAVMAASHKSG